MGSPAESATFAPAVVSLGCRLNMAEGETARILAANAGLSDTVVVNTCAVTGEAVRQAGQTIRRLRRERPNARIITTGCAAQIDPASFEAMPEVDHVIGNREKLEAATYVALAAGAPRRLVGDIMAEPRPAEAAVARSKHAPLDPTAARSRRMPRMFVQVQTGCDHRCTFCVIPFGRGNARSRCPEAVVAAVRAEVEAGAVEVVLTGVDITSYGRDLGEGASLGQLVRRVLREVPELPRLRLTSIDQVEADADLLAALAEEPRLMPHLHLSLQSGADLILKRMRRRHLRADAIAFCHRVRQLRPDIAIGADLIAGFPTETEAHFADTVSIVAECGLTYLHVFPFSPRPGTPAARMPQVPRPVAKARAAALRAVGATQLAAGLTAAVGSDTEVMVEGGTMARTPQFAEVSLVTADTRAPAPGALVRVRLEGHDGRRLVGRVGAP